MMTDNHPSPIDLSPDEFRRLGYAAIDLIADRLAAVQSDAVPVRQPVPPDVRDRLIQPPLTAAPIPPDDLLRRVADDIFPYPMGNDRRRFYAWVNSPPAPLGILADLLAAGHNASVAGGDHAATYVELGVIAAFNTLFGLPSTAGGLLVSGGSVANLVALAAMRQRFLPAIRQRGMIGQPAPLIMYTTAQGHSCLQKAVELLGIGTENLRKLPVDADLRMEVDVLRAAIAADRAAGHIPACVVASAGTVNSGAIDPLAAIAEVCAVEGLWLHVDGAYGGFGILAPSAAPEFAGIERADSIAIDPHKWLYVPIECGCTLVRDADLLRATFSVMPPYLKDDRDLPWFSEYGPQQTRAFRALKLWLTLQAVGIDGYRSLIQRDIDLARYMQTRLAERGDFQLAAAGPLSIICFRWLPPEAAALSTAAVDTLQRDLLQIVQREGAAFLTSTEIGGRTVLRACIVNFRTTAEDIDRTLDILAEAGQRALAASAAR